MNSANPPVTSDASDASSGLRRGNKLGQRRTLCGDRYQLDQVLGGGFGLTYLATDAQTQQPVVLKTLNANLLRHPEAARFRETFLQEAQKFASCSHPHVVRVLDQIAQPLPLLVLAYIPGETLADRVERQGAMTPETALSHIQRLGEGLTEIHRQGAIHRDVKPKNIRIFAESDSLILTDFGLLRELTPGMIQTHTDFLSPGYVAIEQYLPQKERTSATDVYGLAATFYFMLTGQDPIAASQRMTTRIHEKYDPLESLLREHQPRIPSALEQALLSGLSLQTDHRPQTVADWLSLLPKNSAQFPRLGVHQPTAHDQEAKGETSPDSAKNAGSSAASSTTSSTASLKVAPSLVELPQHQHGSLSTTQASSTSIAQTPQTKTRFQKSFPWLPILFLLASLTAGIAGAAVGLTIRRAAAEDPSSVILHPTQKFPERPWPDR